MDHNLSLNETLGKIEPGMSVASFLAAWPAAIPFFLQRQMSCVGCSMAVFDSLEEVSRTYGLIKIVSLVSTQSLTIPASDRFFSHPPGILIGLLALLQDLRTAFLQP